MVVWRVILWPILISAAGLLWIFVSTSMSIIIPVINYFITNASVSVETSEVVGANLNVLLLMPGIMAVFLGIALMIDAIQGDRS